MNTLKKATVIFVIIFGFVNFSLENSISNHLEAAPDDNFYTAQNDESPYARGEQTELSMVSFIVATCTEIGIFPDPANVSNFYVCLGNTTSGFLKYDFSCPSSEYFDSANYQCIPSAATTTTIVPSTTLAPLQCSLEGIFPVPGNCKMYYRCSSTLKIFYFTCPGASYFNELILKCSLQITPACQQQILNNSTTTVLTTLPTSPPTPTPLKNTITAPVTTINTPFTCTASGTFPDPTSCKSYFRCSTKNVAIQYYCPGQSYFNELTKKCSLTPTSQCLLK